MLFPILISGKPRPLVLVRNRRSGSASAVRMPRRNGFTRREIGHANDLSVKAPAEVAGMRIERPDDLDHVDVYVLVALLRRLHREIRRLGVHEPPRLVLRDTEFLLNLFGQFSWRVAADESFHERFSDRLDEVFLHRPASVAECPVVGRPRIRDERVKLFLIERGNVEGDSDAFLNLVGGSEIGFARDLPQVLVELPDLFCVKPLDLLLNLDLDRLKPRDVELRRRVLKLFHPVRFKPVILADFDVFLHIPVEFVEFVLSEELLRVGERQVVVLCNS